MALVLLVPLLMYLRAGCRSKNPVALPINWPILHMFPSFVANLHNMPAYFTLVLTGSGHNFRAHGPPGTGMRFFVTCDPANIQHIFTTNYPNFPKGAEFAAIFDIMGGSLFTIDGEPAHRMRAKVKGVLNGPRLVDNLASYCVDKPPILGLASHGRRGRPGHGHGDGIFPACDANFLLETDEVAKHRPREKAQHG
uniref:Uncharacterized protein n=1 Tax=Triticum urartu TaxID=4572 RepID=A0A8R7P8Q1_TRIUA